MVKRKIFGVCILFFLSLFASELFADNFVQNNHAPNKNATKNLPKALAGRSFPGFGSSDRDLPVLDKKGSLVLCEHYNPAQCDPSTSHCDFFEECDVSHGSTTQGCFSLWANNSEEGVQVLLKGCWNTKDECLFDDECVSPGIKKDSYGISTYFCCCSTSKCNEKIRIQPKIDSVAESEHGNRLSQAAITPVDHWFYVILYAFLPVCTLALLIFMSYWAYRRYRYARSMLKESCHKNSVGRPNKTLLQSQAVTVGSSQPRPIQLIDIKARGRFGCVYRARWLDRFVAVKTFPLSDEDSWCKEQQVFAVAGLRKHPNVLEFFAAEVRGSGPQTEFWLITAYHDNGSVCDYLKTHELTIAEAHRIAVTMMSGLTFLHEEIAIENGVLKACIAHRDFKSKNVLLKHDLTACVCDFGLAMVLDSNQNLNDEHGQVGTHRYMSPEVLEGATEFSAFAFRQIDVYAAALVLWEILSRTRVDNAAVDQYKLPFEEELGLRPKVSEMQTLVVTNRQRPKQKDIWKTHSHVSVFCTTMNDMWDPEPEARITAGCALERLVQLANSVRNSSSGQLCFPPAQCQFVSNSVSPETAPLIQGSLVSSSGDGPVFA